MYLISLTYGSSFPWAEFHVQGVYLGYFFLLKRTEWMCVHRRITLSLQPARVPSYVACPNEPVVWIVFWQAQAPCGGYCLWVVNQQQSKELKLPAQWKLHYTPSVSLRDTIPVLPILWMYHCISSYNWENTFPFITFWSPSQIEFALLACTFHWELATVLISISCSNELVFLEEIIPSLEAFKARSDGALSNLV